MNRRSVLILLLVAAALLRASVCHAADYFVRMDGRNSNSGTSPAEAWATVAHAARQVGAGDTVYIGSGTYSGQIRLSNRGGTAANPVRFVGDTDGQRTGDAGEVILTSAVEMHVHRSSHTHFIGLRLIGTGHRLFLNDNSQGVLLRDCVLEGAGSGLTSQNGGSFVVRNCTINAAGGNAVNLFGGGLDMSDSTVSAGGTGLAVFATNSAGVVIERSSLVDCGNLILMSGGPLTVSNTLMANCRGWGIVAVNGSDVTVINCTFDSIDQWGLLVDNGTHTVRNTIFHNPGRFAVVRTNNAVITESHCLYLGWGQRLGFGFTPTDPILADPMFTDASAGDYTLAPGSPAIDAGTDGPDAFAVDRNGTERPSGAGWDLGAYEAVTGAVYAALPYESGFDTVGPEWVVPAVGSSPQIGGYLGPLGPRNGVQDRAVLHLATTPGETYRVTFSLLIFDGWDYGAGAYQDSIRVLADDTLILTYLPVANQQDLVAQLNGRAESDRVYRMIVTRFTATSDRTRLIFDGLLTGEFPEEAWGIDHVRVSACTPAELPYETDFGTMPGSEWSSDAIDDTNAVLGPFLGRFAAPTDNGVVLSVLTEPGKTYDLHFDAYFIDSWDGGEDLRVFIGGTPVIASALGNGYDRMTGTYGGRTAIESESRQHLGFHGWTDTLVRGVRVRFEATSAKTDIVWRASTDQALNDESWGLDNVRVHEADKARIVQWREISPVDDQ